MVLCHASALAQSDDGFNPVLPSEPGVSAKVVLTVSPEGAGTVSGGGTYDVGKRVYISTSASASKWKFVGWKNAGTGVTLSTSTGYYLTTTSGTTHLVAEYKELELTGLVRMANSAEAR